MDKERFEKPKLVVVHLDDDIILASPGTSPPPCSTETGTQCSCDTYY